MDTTVVRVVIRIGLRRVAPASTRAVFKSISLRYWFTVSTYRIPLLTTVPTSIRNPSRDVMLMALSASHKRPKAPMRQNGMVVITMIENLGDSNWAAMTTNTRKIARAMAWNRAVNSSVMDSSIWFWAMVTFALSLTAGCTTSLKSRAFVFLSEFSV